LGGGVAGLMMLGYVSFYGKAGLSLGKLVRGDKKPISVTLDVAPQKNVSCKCREGE